MSSGTHLNRLTKMEMMHTVRVFKDANDDQRVDSVLAGLAIVLLLLPYVILEKLFGNAQTNLPVAAATSLLAFLAITVRRAFPMVFMWIAVSALTVQVILVATPTVGLCVI